MKIFDIRNNRQPIKEILNLENNHAGAKISLSPDEKYLLCGTSYNHQTN